MKKREFGERLEDLAVRIIRVADALPRSVTGRHIAQQVLRSGTGAGANYCEAQGAESRADFAHKMQIVVKELRETLFWLRTSQRASLIAASKLDGLLNELDELIAIGMSSVVTAKKNAQQEKRKRAK